MHHAGFNDGETTGSGNLPFVQPSVDRLEHGVERQPVEFDPP